MGDFKIKYIMAVMIEHVVWFGKKIGDDFSNVESLSFLNYCFDFRAIKNHFYSLEYFSNFDDPMNEISVVLDLICIYLMDNEYEVSIRKINPTEKANDF